jgi:hypothetical protein
MPSSRATLSVLLVACIVLSGCSGLLGGEQPSAERDTPTAVPVPTPTPGQTLTGVPESGDLSVSPTCERPPGLVIRIQVEALRHNDPATDAGIETVWRFTAPSYRQALGPYRVFVSTIRSRYRPLLTADTVTSNPIARQGDRAIQTVTVRTGNTTTSYGWTVTRQSTTPYDGCWMTSGLTELPSNST